ncbi:hypothetical protein IIA16_02285 [bacterium]|nr:hypothetical protein [bacterium]
MARERFVNRHGWAITLLAAAGWAFFVGTGVSRALDQTALGLASILTPLLLWTVILAHAMQRQWGELGKDTLTAETWPFHLRVPLASIRAAVWAEGWGARSGDMSRLANGACWLAHEAEGGGVALAKVYPGPPDPFLARLAQVAPGCRAFPPEDARAVQENGARGDPRDFDGHPLRCTPETLVLSIVVPIAVIVGAWYMGSVLTWAVGGPVAESVA